MYTFSRAGISTESISMMIWHDIPVPVKARPAVSFTIPENTSWSVTPVWKVSMKLLKN